MKVRMCVSIAGNPAPQYELGKFSFSPGDVVDLHPDLADKWLENGHAEAVEEEPKKGKRGKRAEPSLELAEQESE